MGQFDHNTQYLLRVIGVHLNRRVADFARPGFGVHHIVQESPLWRPIRRITDASRFWSASLQFRRVTRNNKWYMRYDEGEHSTH